LTPNDTAGSALDGYLRSNEAVFFVHTSVCGDPILSVLECTMQVVDVLDNLCYSPNGNLTIRLLHRKVIFEKLKSPQKSHEWGASESGFRNDDPFFVEH